MEQSHYKHSDLTRQIIGCAMKVHNHFGCGFPEAIYRNNLLIEPAKTGLAFPSEVEKNIYYQEQWIGKRRLDVLVEHKVLVELKAVGELDKNCL